MSTFDLKIRNSVRPTLLSFDSAPTEPNTVANKSYVDSKVASSLSAYLTTITGDVSGSGLGTVNTTLSNTGVTPGTYTAVVVDAKGRVTSGRVLSISGDATGSAINNLLTLTLVNTGIAPGTYTKVTVDAKGRVTAGQANLTSQEIKNSLGYTPLDKAGDTMTGNLTLNAAPTDPKHAVTKAYIDSKIWLAIAVGY